jgi:lipoic acid synthetase
MLPTSFVPTRPGEKPPWLKVRLPGSERYHAIKRQARELRLSTVCEEARCPNIGECWGGGTATFMVMGDTCTRGCRFCAVKTARRPGPLDPDEPRHIAETIAGMQLDYVVITSVDRDDLPDQGAGHFAAVIAETRKTAPHTRIEVLIPDFRGDFGLLARVTSAGPDVVAQNLETVERLTHPVRDGKAGYRTTLDVLAQIKVQAPRALTKSSLMVGLGETPDEMEAAMRDLREQGVDFLTIGQYLQPTPKHLPVVEFIHPDQFAAYERVGLALGFAYVASGPLVRSSYKAGEYFITKYLETRA